MLLVSVLPFNSHTWRNLSDAIIEHVESSLSYMYGSVIRDKYIDIQGVLDRQPDFAIVAHVQRASFALQVACRRSKFLKRVLLHSPPSLIALLEASLHIPTPLAFYYLLQDLESIALYCGLLDAPPPSTDLRPWLRFATSRAWKATVHRALRDATASFTGHCRLQLLLHNVSKSVRTAGIEAFPPFCSQLSHTLKAKSKVAGLICYDCGYIADTSIGWHNHCRAMHKAEPISRMYISEPFCLACMKHFGIMPRLWEHLDRDSPKRMSTILAWFVFDPLFPKQRFEVRQRQQEECRALASQGNEGARLFWFVSLWRALHFLFPTSMLVMTSLQGDMVKITSSSPRLLRLPLLSSPPVIPQLDPFVSSEPPQPKACFSNQCFDLPK